MLSRIALIRVGDKTPACSQLYGGVFVESTASITIVLATSSGNNGPRFYAETGAVVSVTSLLGSENPTYPSSPVPLPPAAEANGLAFVL